MGMREEQIIQPSLKPGWDLGPHCLPHPFTPIRLQVLEIPPLLFHSHCHGPTLDLSFLEPALQVQIPALPFISWVTSLFSLCKMKEHLPPKIVVGVKVVNLY